MRPEERVYVIASNRGILGGWSAPIDLVNVREAVSISASLPYTLSEPKEPEVTSSCCHFLGAVGAIDRPEERA